MPRLVYYGLLALGLLLMAVTATLAQRQAPHPDLLRSTGLWDFAQANWWAYPRERNAFKRSVVAGNLRTAFALPGTRLLWVAGEGGLILHSRDGGEHWQQQFPPAPAASGTAAPAVTAGLPQWLAAWVPTAQAAEPGPANAEPQKNKLPYPVQPNAVKPESTPRKGVVQPSVVQQRPKDEPPTRSTAAAPAPPPVAPVVDAAPQALHAIHFADAQRGWAVGARRDGLALLLTTSDGGQTWRRTTLQPSAQGLRSVAFTADGQRGWAVGDNGTLISTNDGGGSWRMSRPVQGASWQAVRSSASGDALWLAGHLSPTGGVPEGLIWLQSAAGAGSGVDEGSGGRIVHRAPGVAWLAAALHPVSQQLWVAGSNGTLLSPEPGAPGASPQWRASNLPRGTGAASLSLQALAFDPAGQQLWLAAAEGGAWRRTLAGGVFQALPTGTAAGLGGLTAVANQVWAVGDSGTVLTLTGDAPAWRPLTLGLRGLLLGVVFSADGRRGWAAGGDGVVLATQDAGANWRVQRRGEGDTLRALTLVGDGTRLWAAHGGSLLRSEDAGAAWLTSPVQAPGLLVPPVMSLAVDASGRQAWAGALAGGLRRSVDGGASWTTAPGPAATAQGSWFQVASSADGRGIWAGGSQGEAQRSQDGGATWQRLAAPSTSAVGGAAAAVQALAPLPDGRLWLADAAGGIAQLSADGQLRTGQWPADGKPLTSLRALADGQRAWAAGHGGRILATQNGGQRWEVQASGTERHLHDVAVNPDGQRLWVVGDAATLRTSADGGRAWAEAAPYQLGWAPWAFAALGGLALGLAVLLLAVAPALQGQVADADAVASTRGQGASTTLASDQPVMDKAHDVLGYREAVEALSSFLRNEATEPRVTVAVSGEWGSGKSSIMRMLQTELRRAGFRTAWYNAWHQQQEGRPLTALFNAIRQQAVPRWFEQPFSALRVRSRLIWGRGGFYRAVSLGAALGLAVLAGDLLGSDEQNAWQRIEVNARHYLLGQHTLVLDSASLATLNPFVVPADTKPDLSLWASACAAPERAARLPSPPLSPTAFCAVATQALPTAAWATTSPSLGCRLRPAPGDSSAQACRFGSAEVLKSTLVDSLRLSPADAERVVKAAQTVPPPDLFRWLQGSLVSGLAGVMVLLFTKGVSVYGLQLLGPLKGLVGAKLAEEAGGKESAGTVERYREEFSLLCDALDGRLVVFIDDLDRCTPDTVNRTLELTNYLVDVGRCFVVIGAAMERVKKCVRPPVFMAKADSPEGQKEAMDYANDYLRKLIHVELPVPVRDSKLQCLLDPTPQAQAMAAARTSARRVLLERLGLGLATAAALGALWMAFDLGTRLHDTSASAALPLEAAVKPSDLGGDAALPPAASLPANPGAQANPAPTPALALSGPVGLHQEAGHTAQGLPRSAWAALAGCAALLAAALAWRRLWRYRETVAVALGGALREQDSGTFRKALRLWSALVIAHDPTPRQVKRFYNRTRLLAAFEAGVPDGIDEAQLVALAAMDHALSGHGDRSGAAAGGYSTDALVKAAAGTEADFALVWEGVPLVRVEGGPPVPQGTAQGRTQREPTPLERLLAQHHESTGRWPTASEMQRFGERIDGLAVR